MLIFMVFLKCFIKFCFYIMMCLDIFFLLDQEFFEGRCYDLYIFKYFDFNIIDFK